MNNSVTQEAITTRLEELREEYRRGNELLSKLEQQTDETRTQILRIAGAIHVCEELLGQSSDSES